MLSLILHDYHRWAQEPEYVSQYSDRLHAGWPWFDSWQGQEIFIFPITSTPFLGLISSSGYHVLFSDGKISWGMKLTSHLHLILRSGMMELYFHTTIHLHGMLPNRVRSGTPLLQMPNIIMALSLVHGFIRVLQYYAIFFCSP